MPKRGFRPEVFETLSEKLHLSKKKKTLLQREPFSQCLYHQQLSITRYHFSFYANNYFQKLPIVSVPLTCKTLTAETIRKNYRIGLRISIPKLYGALPYSQKNYKKNTAISPGYTVL